MFPIGLQDDPIDKTRNLRLFDLKIVSIKFLFPSKYINILLRLMSDAKSLKVNFAGQLARMRLSGLAIWCQILSHPRQGGYYYYC